MLKRGEGVKDQVVLRMDLRALRNEAGVSASYVAGKTGMGLSTYERVETGAAPSLANALKLAKFLELPVEEIWGMEE
jgi:transcriptional regulator with XRE-family HTH domain